MSQMKMPRKRKPLSQLAFDEQVVREKRQKGVEKEPSSSVRRSIELRAGTVVHMILKNFMCHSHLEVTFDNSINYVIGRNGSGKSAILTALVVGLGGKASLTNRGSSVKGFIKAGKNSATVEITLRNSGTMAYRRNVFGNEITIVRHFTASGGGSYKIKSASGEVVSTQSKEVQRICSNLNIQIDNPICLLNQDTSRNFLNTKDPHQKFILFMRATRLEALQEEYKKLKSNKKNAERVFQEKETAYRELRQELKELEKKRDSYKTLFDLKNQVIILHREAIWAKARDAEEETQRQEEVVNGLAAEKTGVEHQITGGDREHSTNEQAVEKLQQQVIELENATEAQNQPQNALVRSLGELKETINEKRREKRVVLKDIAVKSGNCGILEQEISKITENFSQLEQEKMKRLQEMTSIEEKIKAIEDLLETSKNDQFQLRNAYTRLQEEEYSLLSEMKQIDAQIENTNSRLNAFQGESNNVLSLYGRDMPKIVEAINAVKHKFIHSPRGPLGSYITLKDKKWAIAVEGFITTAMLRAFTVDNKKDNELLMKIFEHVCTNGNKPMVITSKFFFQKHDVSANLVQPVEGCISVYSALEISDPVVANCLIDQAGIESMLLIPDTDKAIELMSNRRRVPRNCRQGITIKGDKYYPDPNYKTYASRYHTAQYLQVSTADVIEQLNQKLHNLRDKKQSVTNQHKSIKVECQEQIQKIKELEVKVTKLSRAQMHLKRQYDDIKNVNEPDVANVHTLENELSELKQLVEQRKVVAQKIEDDYEELKTKIAEKEEQLERIKVIVRGYEDRIEPLHQQIREHIAKRKDIEVNKRFAAKRLNELKNRINAAEGELLDKRKTVERYLKEASQTGERLPNLRQVTVILQELEAHNKNIRQLESSRESPEEVTKKYHECREKYEQATELIGSLKEDIKELRVAVDKRQKYYAESEDFFILLIKDSFQSAMSVRQFKASLEINMKEKKLDLIVIPQQGSQGATTTSNLSGGERSFSTVGFLYALWQCMEFPFYFLDEFDVFMDKVNRTRVFQMLVDHAKKNPSLQFVFLTPQDIPNDDKAVTIHKLEDPERSAVNGY